MPKAMPRNGAPLDALRSEDVTAALPAPAETEDLNEGMEPAVSEDALAPEPEPDDDPQLGAVANVDTESMPAVVPVPLRRPPQRLPWRTRSRPGPPLPRPKSTWCPPIGRVRALRRSPKASSAGARRPPCRNIPSRQAPKLLRERSFRRRLSAARGSASLCRPACPSAWRGCRPPRDARKGSPGPAGSRTCAACRPARASPRPPP